LVKFLSAANVHLTELRFEFKHQTKSSYRQANFGIWFGNLSDETAKLAMMTIAH